VTATVRTRIVVVAYDKVGPQMAGPAIRAFEMARVLATEHEVLLLSKHEPERVGVGFEIRGFGDGGQCLREAIAWCDVVVSFGFLLVQFPEIVTLGKIIVVDAYDPFHLEVLVQRASEPLDVQLREHAGALGPMNHQLQHGDFFLCASERQRDLLFGMLASLNRVNPHTYAQDPTYHELLAVVPFGLPAAPPAATTRVLRGVRAGFADDDIILIWAGGLYEWFDPLSLIEAVAKVGRPDVKLFFMGLTHPNPDVPEMSMGQRAVALAKRLRVLDVTVFFNEGWVPYDERVSYLLEADIGVSTHFEHIETAFSFRTRMLDYLWTGLPILASEGDHFAQLVRTEGLGAAVPVGDVDAIAAAIQHLSDPAARRTARAAIADVAAAMTWERVTAPLLEFCRSPHHAADREGGRVPRPPEAEHLYTSLDLALAHARAMEQRVADLEWTLSESQAEMSALRNAPQRRESTPAARLVHTLRRARSRANGWRRSR